MALIATPEQQFHSDFSKNVAALESARKKVNSQINDALRKDDDFSVKVYTKLYLLIYSAWTEASLVRLVHTPFGFLEEEKKKIFKDQDILNKWKKCVNSAFRKFGENGAEIPNKKKKIHKLLDDYLKSQANIRNKIAHGQWDYPLHKNNITPDGEAKILMTIVDVIQIDTWFEIFKEIIEIVRGLIDARPRNNHRAHYDQYFARLAHIQTIISERMKYTLADKKIRLKLKARR